MVDDEEDYDPNDPLISDVDKSESECDSNSEPEHGLLSSEEEEQIDELSDDNSESGPNHAPASPPPQPSLAMPKRRRMVKKTRRFQDANGYYVSEIVEVEEEISDSELSVAPQTRNPFPTPTPTKPTHQLSIHPAPEKVVKEKVPKEKVPKEKVVKEKVVATKGKKNSKPPPRQNADIRGFFK